MRIIPIYPVYNEANCYLLASGTKCAVIDPGAYPKNIMQKAAVEGLTIEKVLLTHGHFDHIMATGELCRLCGCKIYIHEKDLQYLYEPSLNLSSLAGQDYKLDTDIKVNTLAEGDIISIGSEAVKVLSTSGHTPGSVCFIGDGFILSGDTLFAGTVGRTDFPGSNTADMIRSLKKLSSLTGDYDVFPGHSAQTTLEREKRHNYYLQSAT